MDAFVVELRMIRTASRHAHDPRRTQQVAVPAGPHPPDDALAAERRPSWAHAPWGVQTSTRCCTLYECRPSASTAGFVLPTMNYWISPFAR